MVGRNCSVTTASATADSLTDYSGNEVPNLLAPVFATDFAKERGHVTTTATTGHAHFNGIGFSIGLNGADVVSTTDELYATRLAVGPFAENYLSFDPTDGKSSKLICALFFSGRAGVMTLTGDSLPRVPTAVTSGTSTKQYRSPPAAPCCSASH